MSPLTLAHTAQFCPLPPLDNIRVMVIVWRLRRNIIRTALCSIVWHNVHSPQHTYMSSSYRSNRLGLSHWDPYAVRRGGCLKLYYYNMVDWFWWDSNLILTTNWFPLVLWHCWFGYLACKNRPRNDLLCVEWDVKPYTLTHSTVLRRYNVEVTFRNVDGCYVTKFSSHDSYVRTIIDRRLYDASFGPVDHPIQTYANYHA